VYLLKRLYLITTPESIVSGDFIRLLLSLVRSPLFIFYVMLEED